MCETDRSRSCCREQRAQLSALRGPGWVRWRGRKEAQEGGGTCMHTADSLPCAAETNTAVYSNYSPIAVFAALKRVSRGPDVSLDVAHISTANF